MMRTIGSTLFAAMSLTACVADEAADPTAVSMAEMYDSDDPWLDSVTRPRPRALLVWAGPVYLHHAQHGWVTMDTKVVLDLMHPTELGRTIAAADVPVGKYDQLELELHFAAVQTGRGWTTVELEDDQGLTVSANFCVLPPRITLPIEWDAASLLHYSPRTGFTMDDALTIESEANCGASFSG